MSALVQGIMQQLGPSGVSKFADGLGTDESTMQSAIAVAVPAIIAGMARNTRDPQGAESLSKALNDHSPSIFDQLSAALAPGLAADGAKILGHVLGSRQPAVEQNVAQQSGVSVNLIMKLLPLLAPLVMGYLSKQKQAQSLEPTDLGEMLNNERRQVEAEKPGLGGLAAILDADGDGSIIDDIIGGLSGR